MRVTDENGLVFLQEEIGLGEDHFSSSAKLVALFVGHLRVLDEQVDEKIATTMWEIYRV